MNDRVPALRELSPEEEERLARYVAGTLEPLAREALERALLDDAALAEALYRQTGVEEWTRVAVQAPAPAEQPFVTRRRPAARRHTWFGVPRWALAAASLVVVVGTGLLLSRTWQSQDSTFRSAPSGVELFEPKGRVPQPPLVYRWSKVPSAALYRFQLVDEESGRSYRTVLADTLLEVRSVPGVTAPVRRGAWKVTPILANGSELPSSPPIRFEAE